ncbi:N-acetylglucosamine-6-phosphate deacetylase [Tropicibacter oceani]|uniref:N-acetylglucosamine-6-phosphate deacetylase n=1 Tax=Tropicibacter oceani TaxID=3058420 RepID=A0ABY8QQE1_9RHOB|nr:N-acetylglucosamine-6-phosphate deacetylase [Tropicibacter oceani]WGW06027.1 N-acetylglucosamine-6-phosphate deacetylase [Tropicibacter oceani]
MTRRALIGADIFDGQTLHRGKVLVLHGGTVLDITGPRNLPTGIAVHRFDGGTLMPGFVDLQVNGGGGVMFNDDPSASALATIARAHAGTGTQGFLPTLITDTPQRTAAAIEAVQQAIAQGVPGILGLHLEGPHLAQARKGAHDPALIRPMQASDEAQLIAAAQALPNLMVTLAPETVTPEQIARLARAGVIVSLGHSDCTLPQAQAALDAGARCVTHLFNAMSQLTPRQPGLVGAALDSGQASAGLIADAVHVHPASIRAALAAKRGPGAIFLVTDAMATLGSDITEFTLNGRRVLRRDGRLTLADGTLAGADLTMPQAIAVMTRQVGLPLEQALAMATAIPARLLRQPQGAGVLTPGAPAGAIWLSPDLSQAQAL